VVERVCDRMAVLTQGSLVGIGSLEQVFGTLAQTEDPVEQARRLLGK
jgi:ABC-type methionine transport system ATPase subunit